MTDHQAYKLPLQSVDAYISLFGLNDQNISLIEQECHVTISLRDQQLFITGETAAADLAWKTVSLLLDMTYHF